MEASQPGKRASFFCFFVPQGKENKRFQPAYRAGSPPFKQPLRVNITPRKPYKTSPKMDSVQAEITPLEINLNCKNESLIMRCWLLRLIYFLFLFI